MRDRNKEKVGGPVPIVGTGQINVRLDAALKAALIAESERTGRSLHALARDRLATFGVPAYEENGWLVFKGDDFTVAVQRVDDRIESD